MILIRVLRSATPVVGALITALLLPAGCSFETGDGDRVRGSGDLVTDTRPLDDFTRIELAGEGAVVFDEGTDGGVEIEVSDGTLTITTDPGNDIDPCAPGTYRLGCPEVVEITISGAGSVDLAGCATSSILSLELSGAGTIVAPDLRVEQVRASLSGAGTIVAGGTADQLDVAAAGAGAFEGSNLQTDAVAVDASGVADVTVWAADELTVDVSGSGTVRYWGEPKVDETTTGVGSVKPLGPR